MRKARTAPLRRREGWLGDFDDVFNNSPYQFNNSPYPDLILA